VGQLDEAALATRVVDELESIGLIDRTVVLEWRHHVLASAYPVYALDYTRRVREVMDGLATVRNLDLLGRGGRFFYSHLHDQMRLAREYTQTPAVRAMSAAVRPPPSELVRWHSFEPHAAPLVTRARRFPA